MNCDPQQAIGKTVRTVTIGGWRHEIVFTDNTKLQIEPGELHYDTVEQEPPSVIFQRRVEAD